jgi:hypothetical protein
VAAIVDGAGKLFVVVIAIIVIAVAFTVLGFVGPFVAGLGFLIAALVLVNPGGVGSRLRLSIAWWSIPGMRSASSRAAPFAALLLLYTVPVPIGAFALVHAANHGSAPSSSIHAQAGLGGGSTSAPHTPSATVTPKQTSPPTAAPTTIPALAPTPPPTVQPTARPTAVPTPPPTAPPTPPPTPPPVNLCGAPPNPWNFNFCGGGTISSPPAGFCKYFNCIAGFWINAKGWVEECHDGTYSHSGGKPGSCSSHGGNYRPLNPYRLGAM